MKLILGPILLFLVALLAIGGGFVVQNIERTGGPIGEPVLSSRFSPNDDGDLDEAVLSLNVKPPAYVTVRVLDTDGRDVARMADKRLLSGESRLTWDGMRSDGRPAPDGEYHLRITTSSSRRSFEPEHSVRLDRTPPRAEPMTLTYVASTDDACLWRGTLVREAGTGIRIQQGGREAPVKPVLDGPARIVARHGNIRMVEQHLQLALTCAPDRGLAAPLALQPVTIQVADRAHNATLVPVTFATPEGPG